MTQLSALFAVILLLAVALMVCVIVIFRRTKGDEQKKVRSVTAFIFTTTQVAAIVWVSTSYILASYATVALGQPFPATDLSTQAIVTLFGNGILKVVSNIFEHNNGLFFGTSDRNDSKGTD